MATMEQIRSILVSDNFRNSDKFVVRMQFREKCYQSNFEEKFVGVAMRQ